MTDINDGGPAFPSDEEHARNHPNYDRERIQHTTGMTLRDYFAAKAMQSFAATINTSTADEAEDKGITVAEYTANAAYILADAMLAQRAKQ